MPSTTLNKWGNSQGIIIPKSICDSLGIGIGDKLEITATDGGIAINPQRSAFRRSRRLTADEVFAGWDGHYEAPADWPAIGREIDWDNPVGEEIWQ